MCDALVGCVQEDKKFAESKPKGLYDSIEASKKKSAKFEKEAVDRKVRPPVPPSPALPSCSLLLMHRELHNFCGASGESWLFATLTPRRVILFLKSEN